MGKLKSKYIDFGTGSGQVSSQAVPANFTPSNYTPAQVGSEGAAQVSSHLKGIDDALGSGGGSVSSDTNAASSLSWSASGQLYEQTITMPTGFIMGSCSITCFDGTSGDIIYPTIEKVANNQFKVWTNDNSVSINFRYVG